jgi:hypothetical protein
LALSTTVLVVVVITLATLLITSPQAASPSSVSGGGNPAAHTQSGGGVGSGADAYFGNDSLKEQSLLKKSVSDRSRAQNRIKTLGNQGPNTTIAGFWLIERNAQRGMEVFFNTLSSKFLQC